VFALVKFLDPSRDTRTARVEWKVVSTGSGLLAGLVVRRALDRAWARVGPSEHPPPLNPADRRIGWGEAVAWSVAVGAGVGVARMVGDRLAAKGVGARHRQPAPGHRRGLIALLVALAGSP
jgi:hypothetical protein